MLDSLNGAKNPAFETSTFPLSYGVATLAIFAIGFGLVQLGHRVGRGRRERRQESSHSSLTCTTTASAANGTTAASARVAG